MTKLPSPQIAIAAATLAVFFALAAGGDSPPAWMWALLVAVNAATLVLAVRAARTRP